MIDTIIGLIEKIVEPRMKYMVPRFGRVEDTNDPLNRGRVLVTVPSLGWDTKDKGAWCFPTEQKALRVPEVGTFVIIEWLDGKPDVPIYRGVPGSIKDQIPKSYQDPKTQVIFQSGDDIIVYKDGALEITTSADIIIKSSANVTVESTGELTLKTGDAGPWLPNILSTDPFSGVPHGGPTAGIVKLKGG